MSNVQWFYADAQQQQQGPVAFEQIQELAANGQIQPTTLIWNEGMPSWTAASQVQGVFNAGAPKVTAPPLGSPQANPYSTPNSGFAGPGSGTGIYPIPPVKKSSFGLFCGLYVLGFVLVIAGFIIITAQMMSLVTELANEPPQSLETREDVEELEAQQALIIESKIEESFVKDPPIAAVVCMMAGTLVFTISSILGLITLYRAWCVVQAGGARTTPGKAVGFLFIPLFNIYWAFEAYHGWSQDWNRIQAANSNLSHIPRASSGFFLTTLILGLCTVIAIFIPLLNLLFILGIPILYLIMFSQIYRVVNGAAASSQPR